MKRCSHGRHKHQCVDCNPCPHGKTKYHCVQCSPCPHGRLKYNCAACSPCPHGKLKGSCAICSPCPHGKRKDNCTKSTQRFCFLSATPRHTEKPSASASRASNSRSPRYSPTASFRVNAGRVRFRYLRLSTTNRTSARLGPRWRSRWLASRQHVVVTKTRRSSSRRMREFAHWKPRVFVAPRVLRSTTRAFHENVPGNTPGARPRRRTSAAGNPADVARRNCEGVKSEIVFLSDDLSRKSRTSKLRLPSSRGRQTRARGTERLTGSYRNEAVFARKA